MKISNTKICEQANYSIMIRAHAPAATYTAAGYIHCVDFHLHMPICAQGHMKHMVSYNSTGWSTKKSCFWIALSNSKQISQYFMVWLNSNYTRHPHLKNRLSLCWQDLYPSARVSIIDELGLIARASS